MSLTKAEQRICDEIDIFAERMKMRMIEKHRLGWSGWDNLNTYYNILERLEKATAKQFDERQEVDIANLAFILHHQNEKKWKK